MEFTRNITGTSDCCWISTINPTLFLQFSFHFQRRKYLAFMQTIHGIEIGIHYRMLLRFHFKQQSICCSMESEIRRWKRRFRYLGRLITHRWLNLYYRFCNSSNIFCSLFQDYHVIVVCGNRANGYLVLDFDSTLSFPVSFEEYAQKAIRTEEMLNERYKRSWKFTKNTNNCRFIN